MSDDPRESKKDENERSDSASETIAEKKTKGEKEKDDDLLFSISVRRYRPGSNSPKAHENGMPAEQTLDQATNRDAES